jgi:hypothetical protein
MVDDVRATNLRSDSAASAVRLRPIQRDQLCWHMLDVERLIEDDHPVRAIWEFVG